MSMGDDRYVDYAKIDLKPLRIFREQFRLPGIEEDPVFRGFNEQAQAMFRWKAGLRSIFS